MNFARKARSSLAGIAFIETSPEEFDGNARLRALMVLAGLLATNIAHSINLILISALIGLAVGISCGGWAFLRRWIKPAVIFGLLIPAPSLLFVEFDTFLRLFLRVAGSVAWGLSLAEASSKFLSSVPIISLTLSQMSMLARKAWNLFLGYEARGGRGWWPAVRFASSRGALLLTEAVRTARLTEKAAAARGELVKTGVNIIVRAGSLYSLENVGFSYKNHRILEGISFDMTSGLTVIKGDNGSGKSTLLMLLAGLEFPQDGKILFRGNHLDKSLASSRFFRRSVGIMFQDPDIAFLEPVVLNDLMLGPEFLGLGDGRLRALEASEALGITHLLDRSPFTLSRGEKKRVAFAALLAVNPEVYLLDEPFEGLDSEGIILFRDIITRIIENGKSVIMTSPTKAEISLPIDMEFLI